MADDDYVDEDQFEEESKPAGKITILTGLLFLLNIVAGLGFLILLVLDHHKRQEFTYRVHLHEVALLGLPLKEEEEGTVTASREYREPHKIAPAFLKDEYQNRGTGVSVSEEFKEVHEILGTKLQPTKLSDKVLKEIFPSDPKRNLEAEVQRVHDGIYIRMEEAAKEAVKGKKTAAAKRTFAKNLLFPLIDTLDQVELLNDRILKTPDAELDKMVEEAFQRRATVDLLRTLQGYRPWYNPKYEEVAKTNEKIRMAADKEKVSLKELRDILDIRFQKAKESKTYDGFAHGSFEKRRGIAFLLVSIAHLKLPEYGYLYPFEQEGVPPEQQPGPRAKTVVGLMEYNRAVETLAVILKRFEVETWLRIARDRQGYPNTDGFAQKHDSLIKDIVDLRAFIENRKLQRDQLLEQLKNVEKLYQEREKDFEDAKQALLEARKNTTLLAEELKRLELQLFNAQEEVADAATININLERTIREKEKALGADLP